MKPNGTLRSETLPTQATLAAVISIERRMAAGVPVAL